MIEIKIQKDVRRYEAKFIGPFTVRQLICFIISCIISAVVYPTAKTFLAPDLALFSCLLVCAPFIMCGWVKMYGVPFERFVQTAFISNVLSPRKRKYKSKNMFECLSDPLKSTKNKKEVFKGKKKIENTQFYPYA